jgi:hypothetical protein
VKRTAAIRALIGLSLLLGIGLGLAGPTSAQGAETTVEIYAWPSSTTLSGLSVGAQVPWVLVGSATTTGDSYTVPLSNLPALPEVQLETLTFQNGVLTNIDNTSQSSSATSLVGTLSAMPIAPGQASARSAVLQSYSLAGQAGPDISCHQIDLGSVGSPETIVGGIYSTTDGGTNQFIYESNQSSTLGVGISASGLYGSFTEDGTNTVSISGTSQYPVNDDSADSHVFETQFNSEEYELSCPDSNPTYQVQDTQWDASSKTVSTNVGSLTFPDCVSEQAGQTISFSNTTASTFSLAFDVLGAYFSSQTGYSSSAEDSFHFNIKLDLCGEHAKPGNTSPGPGLFEVKS